VLDEIDVASYEAGDDGVAGPGLLLTVIGCAGGIGDDAAENSFSGERTDVPPPKNGTIDLLPLVLQPIVNKKLKTTTDRKNGVP